MSKSKKETTPLVSVIVATKNEGRNIANCLESIQLDQSPFMRSPFAYFLFNRLINNFNSSAFNGH